MLLAVYRILKPRPLITQLLLYEYRILSVAENVKWVLKRREGLNDPETGPLQRCGARRPDLSYECSIAYSDR